MADVHDAYGVDVELGAAMALLFLTILLLNMGNEPAFCTPMTSS